MGDRQSTRNEVLTSMLGRMNASGIEGAGGRQYFMERRGDGLQRETKELTGEARFRLIDGSELCRYRLLSRTWTGNRHHHSAPVGQAARGRGPCTVSEQDLEARDHRRGWGSPTRIALRKFANDVFAAAEGCAAYVEREWLPAERALAIDLAELAGGGSIVFAEATGRIPGLAGRLNPILDTSNRTYLYASDIAINGGQQQPVSFVPGKEELRLMDANGSELLIRVTAIAGRSSALSTALAESMLGVTQPAALRYRTRLNVVGRRVNCGS